MSKKIIRTVGKVAGIVAISFALPGIGPALAGAIGLGLTATTIAGAASLVSVGASLLGKPKAPDISAATLDRLQLSLNPHAPRIMAFGETALGTDLGDQEFSGADKEYLHRFLLGAAHAIEAFDEVWFDDKLAWSLAGGVQGEFVGYLTVTPILEGTPANAINLGARIGASRRFTGCAYLYLRFKVTGNDKKTESPFAQQVPTRVTVKGKGIRCYDPRQDSTQPGGSGAHRADDQTTWTWGDHCKNLACQYATYLLGWRIQNPQSLTWKLSVGKGTPPSRIDWASFIEGANLCDEAVNLLAGGTEPRYWGGGLVADDRDATEDFKAAMNADIDDQDGLLRLTVFHNDLATPDADFTEADIQGAFVWRQTQPLNESFNVVRGSYIEPDNRSLFQPAPYTEASVASPDGIDRVHPADFGLVQSKSQAERLAKQRLQRQLYGGEFQATFLAAGWKVHKNSVVRLSFAPEGWVDKLFRVAEYEGARPDGLVPMTLREESAAIYAWDSEEGPAVQLADPTYYAPGDTPVAQFLGTVEEGATLGATIPDPDGTGGNITKPGGEYVQPGLLRNDMLEMSPGGVLGFRPVVGDPLQEIGQLDIVDLGGAERAVVSRAQAAAERLAAAALRLANAGSDTRATMRDAGIYTDPESGEVRIAAVERTEERLSEAEVRVSAAEANILLRATTIYVDDQIAQAVIDPSQIADLQSLQARVSSAEVEIDANTAAITNKADVVSLTAVEARVTTAETDINALEGSVATKVETTTFNDLETRVSSAEQDITAITGEAAGISQLFRAARVQGRKTDSNAGNALSALLQADKERRERVVAVAEARQEITAKINSDVAAEAAARLDLAVKISAAQASVSEEQSARISGDAVLAQSLTTVTTQVDGLEASVSAQAASIDGIEARYGVRLDVNGYVSGFIQNNDGSESDFVIVADRFAVIDPVTDNATAPFEIVGGEVYLRSAVARRLRVAPAAASDIYLRVSVDPIVVLASDGDVVEYESGKTLAITPTRIVADISALPALAAGDRYDVRAINITAAQFEVRAKKLTSSGTAAQASGAGTDKGAGITPRWQAAKPTAENASDGNYQFAFTATVDKFGYVIEIKPGVEAERYYYEGNFALYVRDAAGWQQVGSSNYYEDTTASAAASKSISLSKVVQSSLDIPQGADRFGVNSTDAAITAFAGVSYTSESVSAETPVAGLIPFTVHPARD